jgi:cellulose synthase/poly-beta-1,6-N-acetylglucosamine synthase-like glycosyltransferase
VVIPARNEARGIGHTLETVFAQASPGVELEVLVVDDGHEELRWLRRLRSLRRGHGGTERTVIFRR